VLYRLMQPSSRASSGEAGSGPAASR
jgi:hypothetical protein